MTLFTSPDEPRNQLANTEAIAPISDEDMQQAVRTLLLGLGEDLNREGLRDTPKRVVKALKFLSSGYHHKTQTVSMELFSRRTPPPGHETAPWKF